MLVEILTLLALNLARGYDPAQVGVWITLLLPWPSYALAVYVLRPTQNDFGLSAPLVMARLLAAGLLGALLLAPWLARFHPLSNRSEEHTSELQSLMRISYAVFCLKKKTKTHEHKHT